MGCALIDACHAFGWPIAKGGSQAIPDALASILREHGRKIETGWQVLPTARSPAPTWWSSISPRRRWRGMLRATGSRHGSPGPYRRFRHGPGAFKLDLAIEGGVPWTNEPCRRAGTVHVAGTFEEIVLAERAVNRGEMPERPFILVGQQYLADPSCSKGDLHPLYLYAHVPNGYTGDATESVLGRSSG